MSNSKQVTRPVPRRSGAVYVAGQVRTIIDEPLEPLAKTRQRSEDMGLDRRDGKQRYQADHRLDPDRQIVVEFLHVQDIIIKTICLVPQRKTILAEVIHRV